MIALEILPSIIALIFTGVALSLLRDRAIAQIFILFVVAYTTIFPSLEFLLSPFPFTGVFGYHQSVIFLAFLAPLFIFLVKNLQREAVPLRHDIRLSKLNAHLPFILMGSGLIFLVESLIYDLFLVRLGYFNFLETYDNTPPLALFHFRISTETSFFVILYLISCVRYFPQDSNARLYKFTTIVYAIPFLSFFLINSRMQFLLLVILIVSSNFAGKGINFPRLLKIGLSVIFLAFTLTLLREFVIEKNYRLEASSVAALLRETTLLIAARLNSVVMVDTAGLSGYDIFVPNFDGLLFLIKFNSSVLLDPSYYEFMKSIEITSPSVYVMNGILLGKFVDFPKSMMVEFLLIFGALALPFLAYILSSIVIFIQRKLRSHSPSSVYFIVALYMLPLIMQFEKEFSGFVLSLFKWSPVLILIILFRPRPISSSQRVEDFIHA